jgi:hypothetical protein
MILVTNKYSAKMQITQQLTKENNFFNLKGPENSMLEKNYTSQHPSSSLQFIMKCILHHFLYS